MNNQDKRINSARQNLWICLAAALAIGMLSHGYALFQDSFSHDSLNAFFSNSEETIWMISLGRFLAPVYRAVFRGQIALPWVIGVTSMVWLGLSGYLIARLMNVRSNLSVLLILAILITNETITTWTGTYIFLLDVVAFGILLAVLAVWFWRNGKGMFMILPGIPLVAASLALYQSNVSVTITLIMMLSILDLLDGGSVVSVVKKGIFGVLMILGGGVVYYVSNEAVMDLTGVAASVSDNSLNQALMSGMSLFERLKTTFFYVKYEYLSPITFWDWNIPMAALLLLGGLVAAISAVVLFRQKAAGAFVARIGLCGVLVCLLPLGMNTATFLQGMNHDLMNFSVWFVYLLAVVILERYLDSVPVPGKKAISCVGAALVLVTMWNNIVVANTLYMKKDLEKEGSIAMMTRVMGRLEAMEEYVPGETEVCFIGSRDLTGVTMQGFEKYAAMTGAWTSGPITGIVEENHFNTYEDFFRYYLNEPVQLCDAEFKDRMEEDPRVREMKAFPNRECIQVIDGVVVVKMG